MRWFLVKLMQVRIIIDAMQDTRKLFTTENTDDCTDAGGTTPRMGEVEQCMEQLPRATHGAVAEGTEKINLLTQHIVISVFSVSSVVTS
jgi:hypothetical protein